MASIFVSHRLKLIALLAAAFLAGGGLTFFFLDGLALLFPNAPSLPPEAGPKIQPPAPKKSDTSKDEPGNQASETPGKKAVGWKNFSPKGSGFKVDMPVNGKESLDTIPFRLGASDANNKYIVDVMDPPPNADPFRSRQAFLTLVRRSDKLEEALKEAKEEPVVKEIKLEDKYAGREVKIAANKLHYRSRFYLVDKQMFSLSVIGSESSIASKDAEKFFGSFKASRLEPLDGKKYAELIKKLDALMRATDAKWAAFKAEAAAVDRTPVALVALLKNTEDAEVVVVNLWPELPADFQEGMRAYVLGLKSLRGKKAVLQKGFNHRLDFVRETSRNAVQKWEMDRETVREQSMDDAIGNDKEKSQLAALAWLKTQERPLDDKKYAEFTRKLDALVQSTNPKLAARRAEAAAVNQKWGNLTPATLVALLDSGAFADFQWQRERHLAMDRLAVMRPPPDAAVAAIAYRYKHIRDKDMVVASFNKLAVNPGPKWLDDRLSDAYDRAETKEKKIELLKVMAAFGSTLNLYNHLDVQLTTNPAPDSDLARELKQTRANMKQRLKID